MEPIEAHPLIRQSRVMVVPGVYDALSARIAERAGFPAVVLTGYGVSATYLGEPDFGILTQSEMLDVARRVTSAVGIGVIVDGGKPAGAGAHAYSEGDVTGGSDEAAKFKK